MKKSFFLFLGISLSLAHTTKLFAQFSTAIDSDSLLVAQVSRDTLPTIEMKFEPWILAVSLVTSPLHIGGHSYKINNRKRFYTADVKPYLLATHDPLLADLYQRQKNNRYIWHGATILGSLVAAVGVSRRIRLFYIIPYYESSNNNYLYWAGGLALAGLGARVVCFRNMRKAVNYYNLRYAGAKPPVTLNLGTSQFAPGGVGVALRF